MAIIDNPVTVVSGGGSVDETSALQYMLNHKTNYTGIAAGLTNLTALPTFTQPSGVQMYYAAFQNCSKLTSISGLDTSAARDYSYMFQGCAKLSNVTQDFTSTYPSVLANYMFDGCTSLQSIPTFAWDKIRSTNHMFYGCKLLQSASIGSSSSAKIYDATNMFTTCTALQSVAFSKLTFDNATSLQNMFQGCSSLSSISFSNVTTSSGATNRSMYWMFRSCRSLGNFTKAQLHYFTNGGVTSLSGTFYGCSTMTSIQFTSADLEQCTSFYSCCDGCTDLTTLNGMDFSGVTATNGLRYMVRDCTSLSNTSLNNILASLLTATSYTGTKTLAYIGLTSAQATTCTGLSNWSALSAAGWTTGY